MKMLFLAGAVLIASACSGGGGAAVPAGNGTAAPRQVSGISPSASLTDPNVSRVKTVATVTVPLAAGNSWDVTISWSASGNNAVLKIYLPPTVENDPNTGTFLHDGGDNGIISGSGSATATYSFTAAGGQTIDFDLGISQLAANTTATVQSGTYAITTTAH